MAQTRARVAQQRARDAQRTRGPVRDGPGTRRRPRRRRPRSRADRDRRGRSRRRRCRRSSRASSCRRRAARARRGRRREASAGSIRGRPRIRPIASIARVVLRRRERTLRGLAQRRRPRAPRPPRGRRERARARSRGLRLRRCTMTRSRIGPSGGLALRRSPWDADGRRALRSSGPSGRGRLRWPARVRVPVARELRSHRSSPSRTLNLDLIGRHMATKRTGMGRGPMVRVRRLRGDDPHAERREALAAVTPYLSLVRAPLYPAARSPGVKELVVATYNVHRWTGTAGTSRSPDPERAVFVISELGADVIALQEVMRPLRRRGPAGAARRPAPAARRLRRDAHPSPRRARQRDPLALADRRARRCST